MDISNISRVKTAIVGCGMISNIYIINLKSMFHIIDLAAVSDINIDSAKKKAELYGIPQVMSVDEIAASKEIELVINLTGPSAHYEVIKKMLLAGKNVFTEKTLAVTMDEADELIRIADEQGLYLGAAPDTVLGAGIQTAINVISSGFIGRVTSCLASINRNQPLNSEIFRFMQKGSGGCFPMDVGIYYVAALLAMLGPVRKVSGMTAVAPLHEKEILTQGLNPENWQLEGDNLALSSVEFESGVLGSIHLNGLSINQQQSALMIFGTEGILELGRPDRFDGYVKLIRPESEGVIMPFTHGYNGKPLSENPTSFELSYGHRGVGAAEMAWAMRENRKCRLSKEFAYHSMELLYGMHSSGETGKVYEMRSSFEFKPLKSGYYSTTFNGWMNTSAERSLI